MILKKKCIFKEYGNLFLGNIIFSYILYATLMNNQLVNQYDGIWEYNYRIAGSWELSCGRWFWPYLDRLRMGISIDPITTIITLSVLSVAMIILVDIYDIKNRFLQYLICYLFLSNTVVCNWLSYRFMSPTFGISFLLSILAAWVIVKIQKDYIAMIGGAILIATSMGGYQANIGCTCAVLVGCLLIILVQKHIENFFELLKRCVIAGVGGVGIYLICLKVHLYINNVTMTTYNGANNASVLNSIKNTLPSIEKMYLLFYQWLFDKSAVNINVFEKYYIFPIILFVTGVILICVGVKLYKVSKWNSVLFFLMIILMPIACNFILFATPDAGLSLQMTGGFGLLFPIFMCLIDKTSDVSIIANKLKKAMVILMIIFCYGNICQVVLDQNAMLEGKIATTTIAQNIVSELSEEECLDNELEYCIIGLPENNELFCVSPLFYNANPYAKFGDWWTDPSCSLQSWKGVFRHLCGLNINTCSVETYNKVLTDEFVRNMPIYPEEGYIKKMGNVVIIKVAE